MSSAHGHEADASRSHLYGLVAEFEDAHHLIAAARKARDAGYRKMDGYAPFPVEGLSEALGHRDMHVPLIMLAGGIAGAVGGFALLTWCTSIDYPLNIGGRPNFAWAPFIPITFEITVLLSAIAGIVGMFWVNGLPAPYHPLFDAPNFHRASSDRFFLVLEAKDPTFDLDESRRFLETLDPVRVSQVEEER